VVKDGRDRVRISKVRVCRSTRTYVVSVSARAAMCGMVENVEVRWLFVLHNCYLQTVCRDSL
jgi:hypothetical protein